MVRRSQDAHAGIRQACCHATADAVLPVTSAT
jgi:hypothetical protein